MTAKTNTRTARKFVLPESLAENWMSLSDACKALEVSRFTIATLSEKGVLVVRKYGKFVIVSRKSVDDFLKQFTT